ncbi:MAG TPA: ATP-binding protein [Gaiellaceae bacterium]|nr:ATP-binding protein [Gaiellaceae bacterium]
MGARADPELRVTRRQTFLRWVAIVRLLAVPFAVFQVALSKGGPAGHGTYAWATVAVFAVGAVALYRTIRFRPGFGAGAGLVFDFGIASAFCLLYAWQPGTPLRQVFDLVVIEGTTLFVMRGGVGVALASTPVLAWFEKLRSSHFRGHYRIEYVTFQLGVELLIALLVGWLVLRLAEQTVAAESRVDEAESLRDELGRRADLLDAANRCARALSSSLDLDEAFGAFIRELRGLVPFERVALVLVEGDQSRVIAAAGAHADDVEPPGSSSPLQRNLLADLVAGGQTIYRRDMDKSEYAEEEWMLRIGLRSRVAAPLLVGARVIGMLSLSRTEADAFANHEIELITLLGRLAASAVQNIRAYDSERRTVEELRRLSALRADFVSLVSHEMRSPMAAVIGAARTLEQRWRELTPDQREAFLGLIADETTRLAALIGDVLDTSRIDAGTFSFRFADVDVSALVNEAVASATLAQSEIPVVLDVRPDLPQVRGDSERLRQVLGNLIDNAVKYSPDGESVEVRAAAYDHAVVVSVHDRGPGIAHDDQRLIFEKFGRVSTGNSKPGTGLGLYIARSIAEAHGGSLEVASSVGRGSTFTLRLPS